jgi:hydrogenase maturation protease
MTTACEDMVVLGIGNPILSDDGVGIAALDALAVEPELPDRVRLIDGGTVAPDLLGAVAGCNALIVLDAVDVGEPPGTVVRLDLRDGVAVGGPRTVHDLGLAGLLGDLRLLGQFPERAILIGVQPDLVGLGTKLSPAVARAMRELIGAVLQQLREWMPSRDQVVTVGADVPRCTEDLR